MRGTTIAIVGGGSAGWLTAHLLNSLLNRPGEEKFRLIVIESAAIGRIGVGEATIPSLVRTLQDLRIEEGPFMRASHATFKHAIKFVNWRHSGPDSAHEYYYHAFENFSSWSDQGSQEYYGPISSMSRAQGIDISTFWWHREIAGRAGLFAYETGIQPYLCDGGRAPKTKAMPDYRGAVTYAYHVNAESFADYLAELAQQRLIERLIDEVTTVNLRSDGSIESLATARNGTIAADFFVDCTGFAALLIEKALKVPFIDYGQHLLCDRAIALPVPHVDRRIRPFTTATALEAGWSWEIDLTSRCGSGYVYSSSFISDNDAEARLRRHIGARSDGVAARRLRMRVGRRAEFWHKNCAAIGLSAGFLEPLESTGIYLIEAGARVLAEYFADWRASPKGPAAYNAAMTAQFEETRDFIALHYCLSKRTDSPFWKEVVRPEHVPPSLAHRLELWRSFMPSPYDRWDPHPIFDYRNYQAILFGLGWRPDQLAGRASAREPVQVDAAIDVIHAAAERSLELLPTHEDLLAAIHVESQSSVQRVVAKKLPLEACVAILPMVGRSERIKLSSGTSAPQGEGIDPGSYHVDCAVPKMPWREPQDPESQLLEAGSAQAGPLAFVAIVRPPEAIVQEMRSAATRGMPAEVRGEFLVTGGPDQHAVERAGAQIAGLYAHQDKPVRHLGLLVNRSGYKTITSDKFDKKRIGLHFDGFSQLPMHKRADAPNRLCINLGAEARRLLFVNLTASRILAHLSASGGVPRGAGPTDLGRLFMRRFPDYPVVSVEVRPGEAYIAPTEDLIHDGASDHMTGPDITYTIIGYFEQKTLLRHFAQYSPDGKIGPQSSRSGRN